LRLCGGLLHGLKSLRRLLMRLHLLLQLRLLR
jgi:hypothetical protein